MPINYSKEIHATLQVHDLDKAKEFYTKTLELSLVDDIPQAGWASVMTAVDGAKIGLSKPFEGEPIAANVVNLSVSSASEARVIMEGKDLECSEMIHFPGMISMFTIQDPFNNTISFIGPPEQNPE